MNRSDANKTTFLKYGIPENIADSLINKGFTVTKIQNGANKKDLNFLQPTDIDFVFSKLKRQPIPDDIYERLVKETELSCCFCWNILEEKPVIIHHIEEYASTQDNSYNNLIVLCLNHHGEVHTKREISQQNFSKIRLLAQKESWIEALRDYRSGKRAAPGSEEKSKINVVNSPGAIISQNQTGGQIAHKIINQKPDRRTFQPHRNLITSFLKKAPPCPFEIHILMNDLEVADLAKELIEIFDEAGWKDGVVVKGLGGYYPPGVTVTRDQESKQSDNILEAIFRTGFKNVTGAEKKDLGKIGIYIGPNPDNYR